MQYAECVELLKGVTFILKKHAEAHAQNHSLMVCLFLPLLNNFSPLQNSLIPVSQRHQRNWSSYLTSPDVGEALKRSNNKAEL